MRIVKLFDKGFLISLLFLIAAWIILNIIYRLIPSLYFENPINPNWILGPIIFFFSGLILAHYGKYEKFKQFFFRALIVALIFTIILFFEHIVIFPLLNGIEIYRVIENQFTMSIFSLRFVNFIELLIFLLIGGILRNYLRSREE